MRTPCSVYSELMHSEFLSEKAVQCELLPTTSSRSDGRDVKVVEDNKAGVANDSEECDGTEQEQNRQTTSCEGQCNENADNIGQQKQSVSYDCKRGGTENQKVCLFL